MDTSSSIKNSFKWSAISEVLVKIISPILNAVLAHILLPEDYAPLATITMIISFCEVFVESGFRKYLIQHEFESDEEEHNAYSVAFWTTLGISMVIWGIIAAFCKPLSVYFGNEEIWLAIAVSGGILPMYAMVGIFNATIQKQLGFKKLFVVRTVTAFIPLLVTIPLALLGAGYWSLVIGHIAGVASNMIGMKIQSRFKVKWFYSVALLRKMFSDTFWTLSDGIVIWLTAWIDSLIITQLMSDYYLGLYRNSLATITGLFTMVTAAVTPVLFVGLSKLQKENERFSALFLQTQQVLAVFLIPMGVGVYLYQDLAVQVLFGDKWAEAAPIVGITAITLALRTVFVSICSDAYRAKGAFRIPLFLQLVDLGMLVPICLISARYGFWHLVYARALSRLILIIPEILIMKKYLQINTRDQLKRLLPVFTATAVMTLTALALMRIGSAFWFQFCSIAVCIVVYFAVLLVSSAEIKRTVMQNRYVRLLINKIKR